MHACVPVYRALPTAATPPTMRHGAGGGGHDPCVFPQWLGIGTVGVFFVRDDDANFIPDAAEVQAVQDYIDALRPVAADLTISAPTEAPADGEFDHVLATPLADVVFSAGEIGSLGNIT